MPFLRDEGPPIPQASIQKLRETLPVDYGWAVVNETGREVLVVRVPKAKPDYLHDLAEVAFYVGLDAIRNTKDVLLIGHEKTARLEPQLLRDHIRAQAREDANVVEHLRRQLDRQYGQTFVRSPSNHLHAAFAVRIPKETIAQFTPEDVNAIRQIVSNLRARVLDCQYAYVIANADHERLGRRVLMELIGDQSPPPAPVPEPQPLAQPVAQPATKPVAQPMAQAAAQPAARTAFPLASLPTMAPAAPAAAAAAPVFARSAAPIVAPGPKTPSFIAAAMTATPPPSPFAPSPSPADPSEADVTEHEEYTIVSKPKPKEAAAPVAPVHAPQRLGLEGAEVVSDEYEIVSKPKAIEAEPAPQRSAEADATRPTPADVAAPTAPDEARHMLRADHEFEVFTSKPKPKHETPSITPPGKAGFQAAFTAGTGPAPSRTKEYEIIGRTSITSDPSIASKMRLPSASGPPAAPAASPFAPAPAPPAPPAPMRAALPPIFQSPPAAPALAATIAEPAPLAVPLPPRIATPAAPSDSGAAIVVRTAPAAPELILSQRFKEAGYEIVEGLRAQGTTFAFAAHKPNGRRVLVKRSESFTPEEAATLSQLVAALGADVALVVADQVKAGTRLATWGTRIEVVTTADVPSLMF